MEEVKILREFRENTGFKRTTLVWSLSQPVKIVSVGSIYVTFLTYWEVTFIRFSLLNI